MFSEPKLCLVCQNANCFFYAVIALKFIQFVFEFLGNDDLPSSPVGPDDVRSMFSQNVNGVKSFSQDGQDKRSSSVEALPTRDMSRATPFNPTPEPFHKGNVSIKKFSAPTSPTKKHPEETVDLTSLHAPGSPQRPTVKSKFNDKPVQTEQRPKLSDRTQEFTKDTATLHANTVVLSPKEDELPLSPEILTFPSALPTDRFKNSVSKLGDKNDVTPSSHPVKQEHQKAIKSPIKSLESHNKENIPEIPKRRNVSITKSWTSQSKTSSTDGGGQIIELGRVSMDASMLKSKAAIAANEIMKESRTIMIVPRGRDKTPGAELKTNKQTADKQVKSFKQPIVPASPSVPKMPVKNELRTQPDEKLPTSSIDEVIANSTTAEPKSVKADQGGSKTVAGLKIIKKQPTNDTKADDKPTEPSQPKTRSFVINSSSNNKVITSRSTESNAAANARFGSKLNSGPSKKTAFGGKSFVIDPSKFKRSSAQPPTDTTTKTAKVSCINLLRSID